MHSLVAQLAQLRDELDRGQGQLALAEAVFVIDGAIDSSEEILHELCKVHPWLRVITLSRHFGGQGATVAGILHTSGDWVYTLDENSHLAPEQLVKLLKDAVSTSADVVYVQPSQALPGPIATQTALLLEKLVTTLTGNPHIGKFSRVRLLRGSIARAAAAVSAKNTHFDVALNWFTTRVRSAPVDLDVSRLPAPPPVGSQLKARLHGTWRLLRSSENRLATIGLTLGAGTAVVSVAASLVLAALRGFGSPSGPAVEWTLAILLVLFLGGLVVATGSIVLGYVATLLVQSLGQPVFFEVDRSRDRVLVDYFARQGSHVDLRATSQST